MSVINRDKDGNAYFEITEKRRVSLSNFRGKPRVDLREFYNGNDGTLLPGKKGISLSLEEYNKFKSLMPAIEEELFKLQAKK